MPRPIHVNTPEEITGMRRVGYKASLLLDYITDHVVPGVTTLELDRLMLTFTENELGCRSACLNYAPPGYRPYPAATCISPNHVICHGIPSASKVLRRGDIVNIDITIVDADGYYGDNSRMFLVGTPSIAGARLSAATFECMWRGIEAVRPGAPFSDIGVSCRDSCRQAGFSVVREYGGHGIGRHCFHGEPHVSHYPPPGPSPIMEPGMIFTVEPMVNAGQRHISHLNDGWTVVTRDHSLSAQWELEVLVTEDGYDILTVSPGSPPPPPWVKGWRKPAFS